MKKIAYAFLLLGFLPNFARAQQAMPVRGLEITPFLIEVEVEKGKSADNVIEVTNRSDVPVAITVQPKDFLPGDEGQPTFVPDTTENDPTFSLASWVRLTGADRFLIPPNTITSVPFSINPPANAEQGTHYGAILFSYSSQESLGNASEVTQSLGTIVLVRYGEAREGGEISSRVPKRVYWNADKINITNVFDNIGNVHVKPKGEVYVKNMVGQLVATSFINRDAVNVLPKSQRTFVSSWIPSGLAFGRYALESVVMFGDSRLEKREIVTVWVLPFYLVIALIAILLFLIWVMFHGRHVYKRRILRRYHSKS